MSVLVAGLPDEALCKQEPGDMPWGVAEELLAQLVEEVSIVAAGYKRPNGPISVPRPGDDVTTRGPQEGLSGSTDTGLQARGLGGFLAAAQVYGAMKAPGAPSE